MFKRFLAVLVARNKEFLRDRSALGWNIVFPVLVVGVFAFAYSGDNIDTYKVGVYPSVPAQEQMAFFHTKYVQFIPVAKLQPAITKVERHQLDMLLDTRTGRYWINDTSHNGYILERVLRGSGGAAYKPQTVTGAAVRYVDWVLPGVLAMNMMFSALYGVGFVIVRYRKNGVLKRLKATPLSAVEFLAAQLVSRLLMILVVAAVVYIGTDSLIHFRMLGSYLDLLLVFALGSFSLIALGLVVAARFANEEMAGGLVNLLSWPMIFLSGVWFSLEGLRPWVQHLAQIFPLTHLIEAMRAIMIDGAGLAQVWPQILVLLLMSALFLLVGALLFRWE